MSNNSNLDAMLECGQASSEVNDRAIAILKADNTNETALRYKFIVGRIMARDTSYETAVDYAPAIDAKPGIKGKWQPFPVNEPATFDAKVHRPLVIHNRYRAALTAWSQVRAAAELASKVAPRAAQPGATSATVEDAPITIKALAVPAGANTLAIVKQVTVFDGWLSATLATNGARVKGDAGALLRKLATELHEYIADFTKALEADAVPAPTVNEARDAELEASRKAMAEMAERLRAMEAQVAKPKAAKLAKAA